VPPVPWFAAVGTPLQSLFAIALVVSVLSRGEDVIVPLALAVFIAFVLNPAVYALERRVPRVAAIAVVLTLALALAGASPTSSRRSSATWRPRFRGTGCPSRTSSLPCDSPGRGRSPTSRRPSSAHADGEHPQDGGGARRGPALAARDARPGESAPLSAIAPTAPASGTTARPAGSADRTRRGQRRQGPAPLPVRNHFTTQSTVASTTSPPPTVRIAPVT
jgi:hypothetical protein